MACVYFEEILAQSGLSAQPLGEAEDVSRPITRGLYGTESGMPGQRSGHIFSLVRRVG